MSARFSAILKIIAQQATTTTTPAAPIIGTPTPFDPYSFWPTITLGWGTQNIAIIRRIANILNWSIFMLSNGKLDMNKLRDVNFIIDTSQFSDKFMLIMARFAIQMFQLIYNSGRPYTAVIQDAPRRIQLLNNTISMLPDSFVNINLTGKIGGNPKILILNLLKQIR